MANLSPAHQAKPEPVFLSVAETAQALHISERLVRRLVDQGLLPHTRLSTRVLIPSSHVHRLEQEALAGTTAPTEQRGT